MTTRAIINNIYDVIKATAIRKSENNGWIELSSQHEKEARAELGKWLRTKEIMVDLEHEFILIGKHIKITIERS
jgi:hypothetical protein